MIFNYLKIAVRTLVKKKFYSLINIGGLALGLMAAMFIWQYISFERSYDDFHEQADQIFRVPVSYLTGGRQDGSDAMNAAPVGPALKAEYPEVEAFVRMSPEYGRTVIKYESKQFEERKIYYVDSNFFDFFGYPLIAGDITNALVDPFSIVLTKKMAERYFGPQDTWGTSPVGKTIRVNNMADLKVTAIAEDVPENTHFKFNALVSFSTFPIFQSDPSDEWEWNDFYTYVRLDNPTQQQAFNTKLVDFADRHLNSVGRQEYKVVYSTQAIKDIHLHSNLSYEPEPHGDGRTVSFLLLIGITILIIAWANYINLATARAEERANEVGVRKVIGATRRSLIMQFLTEAFLINACAISLAFLLVQLFQPLMNILVGKSMESFVGGMPVWTLLAVLVLLFGTLLSGIYPAFILSAFTPARTIKSSSQQGRQDWFRKGLVTFQYASSVVLIISTLIIFRQLNFMKNRDLGFSIDQKLVINAPSVYQDSVERHLYQAFRNSLLQNPQIANVSASSAIPGKYYNDLDSWGGIRLEGADESMGANFTAYRVDDDYYDTYGLQIIAGNPFSKESTADDMSFSVNEAALSLLGIASPEDAIGKKIRWWSDDKALPIVNVFKNYNHKSLKHAYEPTILLNFVPDPDPLYYSIRFNGNGKGQIRSMITSVENTWMKVFPQNPFNYFFFDEQFNEQYLADDRLGRIIATFALFAVFIACLGLFGLTSYMISVKTKEIGIRKVLGASISSIVFMLTKGFLKLVLISLFIAIPLALYFGHQWLNNFAYKTSINWWIFALAGSITLLITLVTVSTQSIKAALTNPVESLKNE